MNKNRTSTRIYLFIISVIILISSMGVAGSVCAAVSREPRLNVKNLYITRDSTYKLRVYNCKKGYYADFSSNDSDIVTIKKSHSRTCTLKPRSSGSASVSASVYDENGDEVVILKCRVTVSPPAISVKFNRNKLKIVEGNTKKLAAIVKPNISSEQPRYFSDNTRIATVSSTGTISAVSEGQTLIHASIANGREDSYIVIVSAADRSDKNSSDDKNSSYNFDNSDNNTSTPAVVPTAKPTNKPTNKPAATAIPAPTQTPAVDTPAPLLPPYYMPEPYKNNGHDKQKYKNDPFFMNYHDYGEHYDEHDEYDSSDMVFDEHTDEHTDEYGYKEK